MQIKYKKKTINTNLILGIVWLSYGVVYFFMDENFHWYDCFWLLMGVAYLVIYFHQKNQNYLSIENGVLKENWPFGKKIKIDEIISVKDFAGDFIIKTKKRELTINSQIIDNDSYILLKEEIKKYIK